MATNITLDDLVEAIANAVVRAQDQVERHQTSLLRAYFDGDGRPLSVKLRVQSLRDDSDEFGEEILVAPLIALVGRTTLSIKELEISTKVTLGDLSEIARAGKPADSESAGGAQGDTDANTPDPFPNLGATGLNSVRLDLGATEQTPRTATAELKLKVVAQEPTEGMARLLVELNKRIVAYPKST